MVYILIVSIILLPAILTTIYKVFSRELTSSVFQFFVIVLASYGIYGIVLFLCGVSSDAVDTHIYASCSWGVTQPQPCSDFILTLAEFWVKQQILVGLFFGLVFQLIFLKAIHKKQIFNKASHAKN